MTDAATDRPVTILIAALGGEGGGVLTNWIVRAAEIAGLKVQNTSIPGVAQRTGATTYYMEIFPTPLDRLDGNQPVLSLYPSVGDIDVMVASEIVEAGRAIQNGFVSPDRTTLVASTHRIYAIGERGAMADGRFDSERIFEAARQRSQSALLDDFSGMAKADGTSLNAVLLGVIAAHAGLPISRDAFEQAIREQGIAVEANLRGFAIGVDYRPAGARAPEDAPKRRRDREAGAAEQRAKAEFRDAVQDIVVEGVRRLVDYQNPAYAARYLDRLRPIHDMEAAKSDAMTLTRETARHLALWMSYEDIVRVAQLKAHADRYGRVLDEVRAKAGEPVVVTEFFKPGIDEFCSVLPGFLARPILRISERRGWIDRVYIGLHIKTTSITGFLQVWLLSKLRPWRPRTWRFGEEQTRIDAWLDLVARAAERDVNCGLEVAECARLIKGYGDTHRRGSANYRRIVAEIIEPVLAGDIREDKAADAIANARAAALSDPSGKRLDDVIAAIDMPAQRQAAE